MNSSKSALPSVGLTIGALGLLWCVIAFSMGTGVNGSSFSQLAGDSEIYNLHKADQRNTQLLLLCVFMLIGTIIFGFGTIENTIKDALGASSRSLTDDSGNDVNTGQGVASPQKQTTDEKELMGTHGISCIDGIYSIDGYDFDSLGQAVSFAVNRIR